MRLNPTLSDKQLRVTSALMGPFTGTTLKGPDVLHAADGTELT